MEFTTVQNPKAHTEIIEQICDAILRGELQKGDMLPPERDIAHQTGISRTVVREAIRTLTDIGMVKTKKGWSGGTQLINIAILNLLGDQIGDEPQALIEFYEVRNIIEIAAAQLTAQRATPDLIKELEETVREMDTLLRENPHDYENHFIIDAHFHRLVVKGSGNSLLFDLYIPILRKLWLVKDLIDIEEFHSFDLLSMKQFVQAVKNRDPQAACDAINAHVQPVLELMLRAQDRMIKGGKGTVS